MAALRLGDIEDFPFLDPPDKRSIRDGVQLLQELGAFDRRGELHRRRPAAGAAARRPAAGPDDPAAEAEGCVREVLVLAAALSIPDPRERPADREEAARQKHARFADEHSDFISYLNLWRYLREQRNENVRQCVPADVPRGVPALPAHPGVAGPGRPAAQHRPRHGHPMSWTSPLTPPGCMPR